MDKKLKKKLLLARNKRHHQINLLAEEQQKNTELLRKEDKKRYDSLQKPGTSDVEPVWSAKLQEIRNKNTGRKRAARDRWNRFAGTSDGGGRGR